MILSYNIQFDIGQRDAVGHQEVVMAWPDGVEEDGVGSASRVERFLEALVSNLIWVSVTARNKSADGGMTVFQTSVGASQNSGRVWETRIKTMWWYP